MASEGMDASVDRFKYPDYLTLILWLAKV